MVRSDGNSPCFCVAAARPSIYAIDVKRWCGALTALFLCAVCTTLLAQNSGAASSGSTISLPGHHVDQICVNYAANRIYVADIAANEVLVIDAAKSEIVATVSTHFPALPYGLRAPRPIAVSERANRFYVTHAPADASEHISIDVFDGTSGALLNSIALSGFQNVDPFVAVDQVRRRIYVIGTYENPGSVSHTGLVLPPTYNVYLATLDEQLQKQTAVIFCFLDTWRRFRA